MEYIRLKDINFSECIGNRVYIVFMCKDMQLKTQKDGTTEFMELKIADKDKSMCGVKLFQPNRYHREIIKAGYIYKAAVDVKRYEQAKYGYSCIIYNIDILSEDCTDFINWHKDLQESTEYIRGILNSIGESVYNRLAKYIISENWDKFVKYPAAKSIHHSEFGGLCVHTCEVIKNSLAISNSVRGQYGDTFVNNDLLVASAILHDVGKTREFDVNWQTLEVNYSPMASLQSHIIIAVNDIDMASIKLCIGIHANNMEEQNKIDTLKHCILAHHGKKEYGSPVEPATQEAMILNVADNISAESYRFNSVLKDMNCGESESNWISGKLYNVYKKFD